VCDDESASSGHTHASASLPPAPVFAREQLLEGATEVEVEDGVDDGIEEAVDVSEPDEEREEDGVDVALRPVEHRVADADGVDNVDCEEGNPTEEEDACNKRMAVVRVGEWYKEEFHC